MELLIDTKEEQGKHLMSVEAIDPDFNPGMREQSKKNFCLNPVGRFTRWSVLTISLFLI